MKSLHLWKLSSKISFLLISACLSLEQKLSCTALVISRSQILVLRPLLSARPGYTLAKVARSPGSSHLHQNPGNRCIHKGLLRQLKDRERGLQQPSSCPLGKLSVWWLGSQGCRTEIPFGPITTILLEPRGKDMGGKLQLGRGWIGWWEYCLCKGEVLIVALGLQFYSGGGNTTTNNSTRDVLLFRLSSSCSWPLHYWVPNFHIKIISQILRI